MINIPTFLKASIISAALIGAALGCRAADSASPPVWSVAGFYPLADCGRTVLSVNGGWRFIRKDVPGAERPSFDDKDWLPVNLPHGLEVLPEEASGSVNYQGPAWYRTRLTVPEKLAGCRLTLYFEAIMGRGKVWIDGQPVTEHLGGYLPCIIDLTGRVTPGRTVVVAVRADNTDDGSFPPGLVQKDLDFCYFGGIYRDAWLIATSPVHITDANQEDIVAGGGVFVHCDEVAAERAVVAVETTLANRGPATRHVRLSAVLSDAAGAALADGSELVEMPAGATVRVKHRLTVAKPHLWHPNDPCLHLLDLRLTDSEDGRALDGGRLRVGIRSIDFRGKDGFFLNGKPFGEPLIGGNRHQDHAVIGNALPKSFQWRDAQRLRSAGMRVIRSAHYPQSPAFMDACDELGLFMIVPTPGWHFWDKAPAFEQLVNRDIRNMVRRDRNHASVLLWEPILNETDYPDYFAKRAHETVHAEYPFHGCFTACDNTANGCENYDVLYGLFEKSEEYARHPQCVFTREWGDNVDNFGSHNSPSRVSRSWGEAAQLVQLWHYALPIYDSGCYDVFYRAPKQLVGGCLWHPFDHQRGYHPDPFFGGFMDAFRQPKYSYWLFASQRDPAVILPKVESGPMVKIVHDMSPFSASDVVVVGNCEEVRLIVNGGDRPEPAAGAVVLTQKPADDGGLPHPPVVFRNVFSFVKLKELSRTGKSGIAGMVAEGLIGGRVVARDVCRPAMRPVRLKLEADLRGVPPVADGSDLITVVASLVDDAGTVKHLNDSAVRFTVSGAGCLVGDASSGANPKALRWGTAPALIRASGQPGVITIRAETVLPGIHTPAAATLTLNTIAPAIPLVTPALDQQDRPMEVNPSNERAAAADRSSLGTIERRQIEMEAKRGGASLPKP